MADDADLTAYRLAPKAFRSAVRKVLPSLATIETFGGIARPGGKRRGQMTGISKPGDGPTTGLIVSADGYIITSTYNFIKKPPVITVTLRDGSQHVAELLGRDETRKLCLLKISGVKDLPVPALAPRGAVRVGQWAVSLGVGYGDDDPAISSGIVSAVNRISGRAVQTDANISPANYGGPLVDVEGRLLGVCVPLSPQSQAAAAGSEWYDSGIGFAVPLDGADAWLAELKAGKVIQPGRLGIAPKPTGPQGGVAIAQVAPNSPALKAGLQVGDQILKIGDEPILDGAHLRIVIGRYVAGDEINISIKRGEKESVVKAKLEAGSDQPTPAPQPVKPADSKKPEEPKKADQPDAAK